MFAEINVVLIMLGEKVDCSILLFVKIDYYYYAF